MNGGRLKRFKAGFQRELEKGMQKMLPGCDILATPHINSKTHVWKKEYGALSDLLSKSGIRWNSTSNTLDITDESIWDAQKRSWPYYDHWLDIFGKDCATGEHAADANDLVNEMLRSAIEHEDETTRKTDGKHTATDGDEIDENTYVYNPSKAGAQKNQAKKRKGINSEMTSFVDTLGKYMKSSDDTFNNLTQRMGTEYDAKIARTTLNDVMKLIPDLSLPNKLKVSDDLVQNTQRLEYFLSLSIEEQTEYVWMLLDGRL
ncbi:hypothetical protein ACS0TY_022528 [Phlomoides rotata]